MKVTEQLLDKYGASIEEVNFLRQHYPQGVEISEIMEDKNAAKEMLHFIYQYFQCSQEDISQYCKMFNIVDSSKYHYSEDIRYSNYICNSKRVDHSEHVYSSNNVMHSDHIYNSRAIYDSHDVCDSFDIRQSNNAFNSKEVKYSSNIVESNLVSWSHNILHSLRIDDSTYIYQSSSLNDCHFCGFMTNSRHCLFCVGLDNCEYYIFNKPIDPNMYDSIKDMLEYYLETEVTSFIEVNPQEFMPKDRYVYSRRFDCLFDGLSADLYGWIGTLPNYSQDVFLQLFLTNKS